MRYMVMHKNDEFTESGQRPEPELVARMGAFIGEHASKGQFLDGEGLGASATRTRLTFAGGRCTVKHGPYAGSNELPAATLLLKVESREQAIGWAERYGKILGDGEIELGPVTEPWDLGFGTKPERAPLRILALVKADQTSEAGQPRSPKQKADLSRLKTEMTKAGVLVSSNGLQPSSKSKRLYFTNNDLRLMDGPFSESKELIGGFALLDLPSLDAVIQMSTRYAAILGGTLEIDVRPLYDDPDDLA
jgi:hypothetical protein